MVENDLFPAIAETEEILPSPPKNNFWQMFLRFFVRRVWWIGGFTFFTTTVALVIAFLRPSTYTGNFYLLVEPITAAGKLSNSSTLTRTQGIPQEELVSLDYPTNLIFLQSPGMTLRIARDVSQKVSRRQINEIWKDLRENFSVEWVRSAATGPTKIFKVSYKGEDPTEVKTVLDIASETFVKYSSEDRETSIKAGVKFIDKQLPALQQTLNNLKNKQKQIRQQYDLVDPTAKNALLLEQVDELTKQKSTIERQLLSLKTLSTSLQQQLGISSADALVLASLNQDPERLSLQKELLEIQSQLINTQSVFTDKSVRVENLEERSRNVSNLLRKRTEELLKQFSTSVSINSPILSDFQDPIRLKLIEQFVETTNQIKALESQLPSLSSERQQVDDTVKKLPTIINQYTALEREIKLTEEVLDKLLVQRETLKVESAQELPWQLISKPQIPLDEKGFPSGDAPNRLNIILAGFSGGLLLSTLLVFCWEKYKDLFFSADDIEDVLALPLFGRVPKYDASVFSKSPPLSVKKSQQSKVSKQPKKLQTSNSLERLESVATLDFPKNSADKSWNNPSPPLNWLVFVNVFDDMYAELSFYYRTPPLRAITISSIEPGDGQSLIALNLAIAATKKGKRVLLVDASGKKSTLCHRLNLTGQKGFNYLLTHNVDLESVIQEVPQNSNLYVVASPTEDRISSQHLWSRMEYIMSELQERFDLVIYDLPHFNETTDVYFMTSCTDGMLLVVGVNKTKHSSAKKVLKKANDLRLPLLGAIANFVELE
ncbi:MAG: lipopolysaccharide biosynthesis protein [Snowella sp.]|nr:MAG: lipopolysaccharide biosynthesis protein [Snowella sp.]